MPLVQTDDIQTYHEVHGEGSPLVLLHGALVDHRMWQPQITPFSQEFQVIVYDMRGHGKTGGSQKARYTAQLLANDLDVLLQHLKAERIILCGLSLGGMVAQAFATTYPERISALILCDTAVSATLTLSDKIQTYLLGWSLSPSIRLMGAGRFVDYAFWLAKLTRGEAWFGQNALVRDYVRDCMRSFDTAEMAKVYDLVVRFRGVDLTMIGVPTLVVNMTLDRYRENRTYESLRWL
ncbi:MAG: alpha/beta hydrolase [Chloroflexi bacterium]|nr:alpha/beta hydrolase [Chloroflexota bacterium]